MILIIEAKVIVQGCIEIFMEVFFTFLHCFPPSFMNSQDCLPATERKRHARKTESERIDVGDQKEIENRDFATHHISHSF